MEDSCPEVTKTLQNDSMMIISDYYEELDKKKMMSRMLLMRD